MSAVHAEPSRGTSQKIAAFAAIYIIWGSTYLAIRYGVATIPPFLMAGVRFLTAGAILYAWGAFKGHPRPTAPQWRSAFVIGGLLLLGGNGAVVWAEQTVPSGIAALLVATVPLWLVLLEWIRPHGKRPSLGVMLGIAVGLLGMVQLIGLDAFRGHGEGANGIPLLGALALTIGSLLWATGTLYARTADLPHSILGTGMEMLAGGVCLLIASVATGEFHRLNIYAISITSVNGLLYLIILGSLVAYTAYSWLIHHASPAAIGTYAYVNPVVAVILGWLIARETVTTQTLIGAAIIVAAVVIITTTHARQQPAVPTPPADPSHQTRTS